MKNQLLTVALLGMCLFVFTGPSCPPPPPPPPPPQLEMVKAKLSGFQANLPISTAAKGGFTAQISSDNTMVNYTLTYSNIEGGAVSVADIHFGEWWANGGMIAFLCGGGGKPACPSPSGTVTGTLVATDMVGAAGQGLEAGEFTELLSAIRSGATYADVHTETYPGGEIRGQIRPRMGLLFGRF